MWSHAPCLSLLEAQFHVDVEVLVVCFVDTCDVRVDYGQWYRVVADHFNEVLGYEGVAVDGVDVNAATEFLVEVLEAELVFRVSFHVDILSDQLCYVGYQLTTGAAGLDERLAGVVFRAAGEDFLFVFGSDGDFVGRHVDQAGVEHLDHLLHARSYHEVEHEPFVVGE